MKLIGLMPIRNEDWILGLSLRAALKWTDEIVCLLHACTDGSEEIVREIAAEHPGRVHVIVESDAEWSEMDHRQRLLLEARKHHPTHIALVDADEVLTGHMLTQARMQIEQMLPGQCLETPMFALWRSLDQYRVGASVWANRCDLVLAFGDRADLNWQPTDGYQHHHRQPHGSRCGMRAYQWIPMFGGVMHLQFAPWNRLVAKHRFYRVRERLTYPAKSVEEIEHMYAQATNEFEIQLAAANPEWWEPYTQWRGLVDLDAVPWHQGYVDEMVAKHGRDFFRGLNIDGDPTSGPDFYSGLGRRATVDEMRAALERHRTKWVSA